jgi:hypothetical protein
MSVQITEGGGGPPSDYIAYVSVLCFSVVLEVIR